MDYKTYDAKRRTHGEGNGWRALLTRAAEDPSVVLGDPRCHVPELCDDFFNLCDGISLAAPWKARRYARTAVELARAVGDRHRIHHSLGVLVHALTVSRGDAEKWALLEEYKAKASECCPRCESEYYYRYGDVLVAARRPEAALGALRKSLWLRGTDFEEDWYGRLLTRVAMACYDLRDLQQAISVAGDALAKLDLTSSPGYVIGTIAHMVVFLPRSDRHYNKTALRLLKQLKRRLAGFGDDLADVRGHLLWAEGVLYAGLGKRYTAMKRLESARQSLLKHGLVHEAVAVTWPVVYPEPGQEHHVPRTLAGHPLAASALQASP